MMKRFLLYFLMKLCATLVLVFGNFWKFWEGVSHDSQSTVVGKKKLQREVGIRSQKTLVFRITSLEFICGQWDINKGL